MRKIVSLFAAVLFAGSLMAETVTLKYTGTTTTNMDGKFNANNAELVNLDPDLFIVQSAKNSSSAEVGLNKDGSIRLYADKENGNGTKLTVIIDNGTINSITLDVKQAAEIEVTSNGTPVDGDEDEYVINSDAFTIQNVNTGENVQFHLNSIEIIYTPAAAPAVATPKIAPNGGTFVGEVSVSITCETEDAEIYYTLDGTYPDKENGNKYELPFILTEDTNVRAVAYKGEDHSRDASANFVKIEPKNCSEIYAMQKDDQVVLEDVVVTYVNGRNVWVKDNYAAMLLYLSADAEWQAGDKLEGVAGVVDIYNGLYEIKPSAAEVAAVVATPGEAPAPEALEIVNTIDANKYISLAEVVVDGEFSAAQISNLDMTLPNEQEIVLRNAFKQDFVFDGSKKYDIIGIVSIYRDALQISFISATESRPTAVDNINAADKTFKTFENGQLVIIKGGVKYNALGAQL